MPTALRTLLAASAVASVAALSACTSGEPNPTQTVSVRTTVTASPVPVERPEPQPEPSTTEVAVNHRPLWLGTIPLEIDPVTQLGTRAPTPEELRDRRLPPRDHLPAPEGDTYTFTVGSVPADVAARSTWREECPVPLTDLSYLTMTYWGFDDRAHTGEMLIHRDAAQDVTRIFGELYDARFPIEEMRVISMVERDGPPTGDNNITSGYTCRTIVGASEVWSEHSKGLAVDINPFLNPYINGLELYPELSEAYLDREWDRPGMIHKDSLPTRLFEEIGWGWGGDWVGHPDWMHFSLSGH